MESWNKLSHGLPPHGDFSSLCDHEDKVFFIRHRRWLKEYNKVGPFFLAYTCRRPRWSKGHGPKQRIMFQCQHTSAFKRVDFIDRGLLKVS
jgi:hypothetical protein